ncbi:MAG: uracil-DNA glycosylase family protein [Fusobacteriaceae bacterium]
MMSVEALWDELIFELGSIGPHGKEKNKEILIGSGNRNGDILFIGDDPSLYLDENLRVAPASSGEFLIKLCDVTGLTPNDYYITTITKSLIKYKDYFETDQEQLIEYLNMQIALINPKIIIVLGQHVASIILEKEVNFLKEKNIIKDWIGNTKILVTYDPNFAKTSRDTAGKKDKVAVEFWNALKLVKNYIHEDNINF